VEELQFSWVHPLLRDKPKRQVYHRPYNVQGEPDAKAKGYEPVVKASSESGGTPELVALVSNQDSRTNRLLRDQRKCAVLGAVS
jgi:hypothetical protein